MSLALKRVNLSEHELFNSIYLGIQKIPDVKKYTVISASIKLYGQTAQSLISLSEGREAEIINIMMEHLKGKNRKVKDVAGQFLVTFCYELSNLIAENSTDPQKQELLSFITRKIRNTMQNDEDTHIIISFIKAYGAMAKAIVKVFSEKTLHETLYFLIENSQSTLFNKIDKLENFNFEKNPQNFKAVLFNQKQLISYLKSFSFIFTEFEILQTIEINFLTKIIDISVKYLINFFPPYQKSLCESFSLMLNSLPKINYISFVFKEYLSSLTESMVNNIEVDTIDTFKLFYTFFERSATMRLSLEKTNQLLSSAFSLLNDFAEKSEAKVITYSSLVASKNKIQRSFFFFSQLVIEGLRNPQLLISFETIEKPLLFLLSVINKRVVSHPKNFVCIRLFSNFLTLKNLARLCQENESVLVTVKQIAESIFNSKYLLTEFFEVSVFAEFVAQFLLFSSTLKLPETLPYQTEFINIFKSILEQTPFYSSLISLYLETAITLRTKLISEFKFTNILMAFLSKSISNYEQPKGYLFISDKELNHDWVLKKVFLLLQLFEPLKQEKNSTELSLNLRGDTKVHWDQFISIFLSYPSLSNSQFDFVIFLIQLWKGESANCIDPNFIKNSLHHLLENLSCIDTSILLTPDRLLTCISGLLSVYSEKDIRKIIDLIRFFAFKDNYQLIIAQLLSHSIASLTLQSLKKLLGEEIIGVFSSTNINSAIFYFEMLSGLIEVNYFSLEDAHDRKIIFEMLCAMFSNSELIQQLNESQLKIFKSITLPIASRLSIETEFTGSICVDSIKLIAPSLLPYWIKLFGNLNFTSISKENLEEYLFVVKLFNRSELPKAIPTSQQIIIGLFECIVVFNRVDVLEQILKESLRTIVKALIDQLPIKASSVALVKQITKMAKGISTLDIYLPRIALETIFPKQFRLTEDTSPIEVFKYRFDTVFELCSLNPEFEEFAKSFIYSNGIVKSVEGVVEGRKPDYNLTRKVQYLLGFLMRLGWFNPSLISRFFARKETEYISAITSVFKKTKDHLLIRFIEEMISFGVKSHKLVEVNAFMKEISAGIKKDQLQFSHEIKLPLEIESFESSFEDMLAILIQLAKLDYNFSSSQQKEMIESISRYILTVPELEYLQVLQLIAISVNDLEVANFFFQNSKNVIQKAIFRTMPVNVQNCAKTSIEYSHFENYINIIFTIVEKSKSLNFLSFLYFLIGRSYSVFPEIIQKKSQKVFKVGATFPEVEQFVLCWLAENLEEDGGVDSNLPYKLWKFIFSDLFKNCLELGTQAKIFSQFFEKFLIIFEKPEDNLSCIDLQSLIHTKKLISLLTQFIFLNFSSSDIFELIYPKTEGGPSQTTKRLCHSLNAIHIRVNFVLAKFDERLRNSEEFINKQAESCAFRTEYRSLIKSAYNTFCFVLISTQLKVYPIVNLLILNKNSDERILESINSQELVYSFNILTEFKIEQIPPEDPFYKACLQNSILGPQKELCLANLSSLPFELDDISKHSCFKPFCMMINFLISRPQDQHSVFLNPIQEVLADKATSLNVKVFLLRMMIQFSSFFKKHREMFRDSLLHFLTLKETGGVGLHYFYRDVCSLFVQWFELDPKPQTGLNLELTSEALKSIFAKIGDHHHEILKNNLDIYSSFVHLMRVWGCPFDLEPLIRMMGVEGKDQKGNIWRLVSVEVFAIWLSENVNVKINNEVFPLHEMPNKAIRERIFRSLFNLLQYNSRHLIKTLGWVIGKAFTVFKMRNSDSELKTICLEKVRSMNTRVNEKFYWFLRKVFEINNSLFFDSAILRKESLCLSNMTDEKYKVHVLKMIINVVDSQKSYISTENVHSVLQDIVEVVNFTLNVPELHIVDLCVSLLESFQLKFSLVAEESVVKLCQRLSEVHPKSPKLLGFLENFLEKAAKQCNVSLFSNIVSIGKNILVETKSFSMIQKIKDIFKNQLGKTSLADCLEVANTCEKSIDSLQMVTAFLLTELDLNKRVEEISTDQYPKIPMEGLKYRISNMLRRTVSRDGTEENSTGVLTFSSSRNIISNAQDKQVLKLLFENSNTRDDHEIEKNQDAEETPEIDFDQQSEMSVSLENNDKTPVKMLTNYHGLIRFNKDTIDIMPIRIRKQYNEALNKTEKDLKELLKNDSQDLASMLRRQINFHNDLGIKLFSLIFAKAFQISRQPSQKALIRTAVNLSKKTDPSDSKVIEILNNIQYSFLVLGESWIINELGSLVSQISNTPLKILILESTITNRKQTEYQLKRVNQSVNSFLPLTNFSKSSNEEDRSILHQLTQEYSKTDMKDSLSALFSCENNSNVLDLKVQNKLEEFLKVTQVEVKNSLVEEILIREKQEAFSKLMKWDKLLTFTHKKTDSRPKNEFELEESEPPQFLTFSKLEPQDQKYIFQSLMFEKNNWRVWRDNYIDLQHNQEENVFLEANCQKELSYFAMTSLNIDKANYHNEFTKENLKLKLARGIIDQDLQNDIGFYIDTSSFINFVKATPSIPSDEHIESITKNLAFSRKKNRLNDFSSLLFIYHVRDLYLDVLLTKFRGFDTSSIEIRKTKNICNLAECLLMRQEYESADKVLRFLDDRSGIIQTSENLSFTQARLNFEIIGYKFQKNQISSREAEIAANKAQMNCESWFSSTKKLQFQFLSANLKLSLLERDSHRNGNSLLKSVIDADNNLKQSLHEDIPDELRKDSVRRVLDVLRKTIRIEGLENPSYSNEVVSTYFSRLSHACELGLDIYSHLPFLFRLFREQTSICKLSLDKLRLNAKLFESSIAQLIGCYEFVPEFCMDIMTQLVENSPEKIAPELNFYRERMACKELIDSPKIKIYLRLFEELENFYDPEMRLISVLKDKDQSLLEHTKELLQRSEPVFSKFREKFGNIFTEDLTMQSLDKLERSLKGKYSNDCEFPLSYFSQALVEFSKTFGVNLRFFSGKKSRKIIGVSSRVLVLNSLRKPKAIEINCEDGKNRMFMVKCGEDLRSDARIMALFSLFNSITEKRNLYTYDVLTVSSTIGLIKWVKNSVSLKSMVENELQSKIMETPAFMQRNSFLSSISGNQSDKHLKLYGIDDESIIEEFDKETRFFSVGALSNSIKKMVSNAAAFVEIRNKLAVDYASSCFAGYVFGIGDRHCDNIMFSLSSKSFFMIDFGCSFNMGIRLTLPELVPFRLTSSILSVLHPGHVVGRFRNSMVHLSHLIRKKADDITDYISVYTQEPLLDWKRLEMKELSDEGFSKERVNSVRQKLNFRNPKLILQQEFELLYPANSEHKEAIRRVIQDVPVTHEEEWLSDLETVDTLIQLATYKAFLGRAWIGWMPIV